MMSLALTSLGSEIGVAAGSVAPTSDWALSCTELAGVLKEELREAVDGSRVRGDLAACGLAESVAKPAGNDSSRKDSLSSIALDRGE